VSLWSPSRNTTSPGPNWRGTVTSATRASSGSPSVENAGTCASSAIVSSLVAATGQGYHTRGAQYFAPVRIRPSGLIFSLVVLAGAASALASAGQPLPSAAQIHTAISGATRSKALWATVNVCDTDSQPQMLGIRGQMPSLGFPVAMSMSIQAQYFSSSKKRFEPVPNGQRIVNLGQATKTLRQGGADFQFERHSGTLRGVITFAWTYRGSTIGHAVRTTTAGHPDADFGSPRHFSASACKIS